MGAAILGSHDADRKLLCHPQMLLGRWRTVTILGQKGVHVPLELHPAEGGDQHNKDFALGGQEGSRVTQGSSVPVDPVASWTRVRCRIAALPCHHSIIHPLGEEKAMTTRDIPAEQHQRFHPLGSCERREKISEHLL